MVTGLMNTSRLSGPGRTVNQGVPYGEGLASHAGPESCVGTRKGDREALTARGEPVEPGYVRAGYPVPEISLSGVPTHVECAEGHTDPVVIRQTGSDPAGSETPSTHASTS